MSSSIPNLIPGRLIRINDKVSLRLWPTLEGRVIRITPNCTLKLRPVTVPPYHLHLHPHRQPAPTAAVVPSLHPSQPASAAPAVPPQLVIKLPPSKQKTDIVEVIQSNDAEDEDSHQEDAVSISTFSSEERDEDWEVSSLGTESKISSLNSEDHRFLADNYDPDWEPSSLGTPSVISPLSSPARGRRSDWGHSFDVQSEWQDSPATYSPPDLSPMLTKETKYWKLAPPEPPRQWMTLPDWRYCRSCKRPHPSGELKRLLCDEVGLEDIKDCDDPPRGGTQKRKRED